MKQYIHLKLAIFLTFSLIVNSIQAQKNYVWKPLGVAADSIYYNTDKSTNRLVFQKNIKGDFYSVIKYNDSIVINKWNGSTWTTFPGINLKGGWLNDIEVLDSNVFISGSGFDSLDISKRTNDLPFPMIKFNGTKWDSLPGRPNEDSSAYNGGFISHLTSFKGKLYFLSHCYLQNSFATKLYEYNTNGTSKLLQSYNIVGGNDGYLCVHDSFLVLGGSFDTLEFGKPTSGIAFYDGTNFSYYKTSQFAFVSNLWSNSGMIGASMHSVNDSILALVTAEPFKIVLLKNGIYFKNISDPKIIENTIQSISSKDNMLIVITDAYNSWYRDLDSNSWQKGRADRISFLKQENNRVFGFRNSISFPPKITAFVELVRGSNINGKIFIDLDSNCIYDSSDVVLKNTLIDFDNSTDNFFTQSDENGNYDMTVLPGNYNIKESINSVISSISPCSNVTVNISSNDSTINGIDIPVHISDARNLSVNINAARGFVTRQGFRESYELSVTNLGYKSDSAIIQLEYPSKASFDTSFVNPYSHSGRILTYKFYNLDWNETKKIKLEFSTSVNTSSLNDDIQFIAKVINSSGDSMPENNHDTLKQKIVAAYDPNIKQCYPSGKIGPGLKKIKYVIHFQNTGNDTAFKVIVTDTITQKLGLRSIRVTGTSHPIQYSMKVVNNQVLVWEFKNILLPDSHTNEKASHGFIAFEAQINNTVALGDSITNKAYIYFDYQKPIITNEASIVFIDPNSSTQNIFDNTSDLFLYPNPANSELNIVYNGIEGEKTILIYDQLGREIDRFIMTEENTKISVSDYTPGMYFVKIAGTNTAKILLIE